MGNMDDKNRVARVRRQVRKRGLWLRKDRYSGKYMLSATSKERWSDPFTLKQVEDLLASPRKFDKLKAQRIEDERKQRMDNEREVARLLGMRVGEFRALSDRDKALLLLGKVKGNN